MVKAMHAFSTVLNNSMKIDGDDGKQIRSLLVDGTTMLGQAMIKTSHMRKRSMVRDLNPQYRRMAFETTPVKSKFLYEDLSKSLKEAFVTGKIAQKAKNPYSRPFQGKGKRPAFNSRYNHHNNHPYKKNRTK